MKTELSLVCENEEYKAMQVFMENNLQDIFSKTVSPLHILIITAMTTAKSERCFFTLKRIKTFLRSTFNAQYHQNALAMLSMEKNLIETFLTCYSESSVGNNSITINGVTNGATFFQ